MFSLKIPLIKYGYSKLLFFFVSILFLVGILLSLKNTFISADAPYYLSVARDISDGSIPYKDIYLSYTPLMMYINSQIFVVFENVTYEHFLGFQFLILGGSSLVLYTIASSIAKLPKTHAGFISILLGVTVLSSDGNSINLEVYSLLVVLLAFFSIMKNKFFIAGFLLGVSFFIKQYGLFNFLPFYLYIFLLSEKKAFKVIAFSAGGVLPLLIFLGYFVIEQKISVTDLIDQLSGAKYLALSVFKFPSLFSILIGGKVFLLLAVFLFLIPRRDFFSGLNIVLLVGIFVNLLPLILQRFPHYYINTFAYLFLLFVVNWEQHLKQWILPLTLSITIIAVLLFIRNVKYKNVFKEQEFIAQEMLSYFPENTEVFLQGKIRYLYLLNDYKNPLQSEVGYTFPYLITEEKVLNVNVISEIKLHSISAEKEVKIKGEKFYLYGHLR